jgi:transposase
MEISMSLKPEPVTPIPEETKRIAEAAFPKGNIYMRMRDKLGIFYQDEQFASLFPYQGQPAECPCRLALICVMQFVENLSDRQAADAVRGRIDWKYALSLELTDSGFDYSVLSEFRSRLMEGNMEQELLDTMLTILETNGLIKKRGKQRTDSSHVIGAIRELNRLENLGETLRAALNNLAVVVPDWLRQIATSDWFDRYDKRIEEYRLPKGEAVRKEYAEIIGADGIRLLTAVYSEDSPDWLSHIPAVETLRRTWVHQYYFIDGILRLRKAEDLPPASLRSDSPYDPEAHYATKRNTHWTGYKVHITETCDDNSPHVITHIATTISPKVDSDMTEEIHEALSEKGQLPEEHFLDAGYVDAGLLITSQSDYQVELVGPVISDASWQSRDGNGYSIDSFHIDWVGKTATCPCGNVTRDWTPSRDASGSPVIRVRFARSLCASCGDRSMCTHAAKDGRSLTLRSTQAEHEVLKEMRQKQKTQQWKERYIQRAGIEGTISQGTRAFGLRQTRYIGLAKTHLQHILTAVAINIERVDNWLTETPLAKTRVSRFKSIEPKAA